MKGEQREQKGNETGGEVRGQGKRRGSTGRIEENGRAM